MVARALAYPFSLSLRHTYCSMARDIPKGRTEIDYFNGHLLALAGDGAVPLNRRAVALVRRMAQQKATPAPHWLNELATPAADPAATGGT
jgi:2-dehydropantoate 2-reductase